MEKITMHDIIPSSKDLFLMASGLLIFAIGYSCFILPYEMTSGGVSGIGALIFYVSGFPPSYTYFIVNVALLLFALKILGLKYTVKTLIATAMVSLFIDLGQRLVPVDEMGNMYKMVGEEKFMACVLGGLTEGLGLGLVFQSGGSTGGSDIIASIINKYKPISLGRALLMVDIFIVGRMKHEYPMANISRPDAMRNRSLLEGMISCIVIFSIWLILMVNGELFVD